VRFLDVTLHNGNTYNTSFMSNGRTAFAYGDDTQCTACGKSVESHRVHETDEAVALSETVFMELMKRLHKQRPLIEKHLQLREERKRVNVDLTKMIQARHDSAGVPQMKKQMQQIQAQLKGESQNKRELHAALTSIKNEVAAVDGKIKTEMAPLQADVSAATDRLTQEMNEINSRLIKTGPILRMDDKLGTFALGYMIGVCICKCPQHPRILATCSGTPTPGFREAVSATPFELVEGFQMSERQQQQQVANSGRKSWECAAPKLLQAGGAGGHKVRTMSERYFSPLLDIKVAVVHERTEDKNSPPKRNLVEFDHGQTVPSCETCQGLVPEMLCSNHKECA